MNKIAILIVGAVTSGKTTLANRLSKDFNLEVINEEKTGNYFKIINTIDSKKHPRVVYDHCYIYTQLKLFSKEYDEVILCFLKLDDNMLYANYESRKNNSAFKKEDYLKINPIQQQNNLSFEISEWKNLVDLVKNVNLVEIPIKSFKDYEKATQNIKSLLENSLQHR